MIKNVPVCLVVAIIITALPSQSACAQSAEEVEKAKKETLQVLKNSTLSETYYLFQLARVNKPNSAGISQFSFDGGTKNYYAPALKEAARADGTYEPFGAVFDVLASFGDA